MKIIEAATKLSPDKSPFDIMRKKCPSDYGFQNTRRCQFRSKGNIPDDMECLKCWTRRRE